MSEQPLFPNTAQPEVGLDRWLAKKGLLANPFERWNAENDRDLPHYFVDVSGFDELLRLTEPCVIFARRGCGKTAQRQMLAAHYRPHKPDVSRLAVDYTYLGFEQTLNSANDDVEQVRQIHHVNAIVRLALEALLEEKANDPAVEEALNKLSVASQLNAYLARFIPHRATALSTPRSDLLDDLGPVALLRNFAGLVKEAGLNTCVALVDGLDESTLTADDPAQIVTFLSHLLGTLPLIECPGFAFKFFLPQELEPLLRTHSWFRVDRLRFFPLAWEERDLLTLIKQRLTFFSRRQPPYESFGQLCEDELAQVIDQELATLAEGLPRAALILAGMLLQYHSEQTGPPDLIQLETWEQVKATWSARRNDFIEGQHPDRRPKAIKFVSSPHSTATKHPVLRVEEENNLLWLGELDITREINPKEHQLLAALYRHQGRICDRDLLMQEAWPEYTDWEASDQLITQSIRRLRKALRKRSPDVEYIETIRGRGYCLHPGGFEVKNQDDENI